MKILNNPYAVGALALAAIALVSRNALVPLWHRLMPPKPPQQVSVPAPVPSRPAPIMEAKEAAKPAVVPDAEIDVQQIQMDLARWLESPRRDPFQLTAYARGTNQPARELLTLKATWLQTGKHLAVINGTIVGEGDTVHGFRIESIAADFVWVLGPAGREQLEFATVVVPGSTNNNGGATVASGSKGPTNKPGL